MHNRATDFLLVHGPPPPEETTTDVSRDMAGVRGRSHCCHGPGPTPAMSVE